MSCVVSIRRVFPIALFAFLSGALSLFLLAAEKPTSLSDARAAVESNLKTPEGKAYDEQLGKEFFEKHMGPLRQCKPNAGDDWRSFWILLKLDKDGSAQEILLYPETKLGMCARTALLNVNEKFSTPPRAAYWVSVYMKLSH